MGLKPHAIVLLSTLAISLAPYARIMAMITGAMDRRNPHKPGSYSLPTCSVPLPSIRILWRGEPGTVTVVVQRIRAPQPRVSRFHITVV